jgi:hypothetical protein
VNTGGFTGGSQKLDGVYWRNFTFTNVQIEYDGGPLALENVRFVNCTFKMRYSVRADQFAGLVLADNSVTSNIG